MKKYFFVFLCFASVMFALSKDTLVIAVENEPSRLNPIFSEDHDMAIGVVFSGLVRFDEKAQVLPDLAKSWKISQDGLVYEFSLKEGVKWHDGESFGADDVIFTLESLKNPLNNSPLRVNFEMIKKIEKLDKNKIRITLSRPYPAFLDVMSVGILPKHLLQGKDLKTDSFNFSPIGTGPYKLKQWKRGQYMRFEANDSFHLGKVKTPKLILKTISNPSVTAVELKNKSIDVGLVDFELASSFEQNKDFKLLFLESADYRALMFNIKNPIFKDKQVRIALNYAVNKDMMLKTLLHSSGFVAHHPLQLSWASPKTYSKYSYDPQKALEILQKNGWKKNKNGVLEKDGKLLSFEIYAMNNDPLRVAMASVLQSEFAKIGVQTRVVAKPSGSFDYTAIDSFLVGWGSPFDPDLHTYRVFVGSEDTDINQEGWNFGHYQNAKVDQALALARNTMNRQKRKEAYADFISTLHDDPPFIFMLYLKYPLVYVSNLKGIKPNVVGHHGVGFTWNVWEWSK